MKIINVVTCPVQEYPLDLCHSAQSSHQKGHLQVQLQELMFGATNWNVRCPTLPLKTDSSNKDLMSAGQCINVQLNTGRNKNM